MDFRLRHYRDFLALYNKITETCFVRCVNQLGERDLTQDETRCVDVCAKKFVNVNHKVMQVYLEIQPQIVNRKLEEMNKQQAAVAAAQSHETLEKNGVPNNVELKVNTATT